MKIIKNFSVFKNKPSDNEKVPTHSLSAKIGESYINIGSAWTKSTKTGDKYLSAQTAKVYVDHTDNTKSRKSVVIVFEEDLKELHKIAGKEYPVEATTPPKIALENSETAF